MARTTVSGGSFRMLPKEGEAPVEGFLKGVIKEQNKFGNDQYNFLLNDKSGNEFKVLSGGTAKYFANNVAMALGLEPMSQEFAAAAEAAKKCINKWIIISNDGSYVNKRKQTVNKFVVEVDSDIVEGGFVPNKDILPNKDVPAEDIPF